MDYVRAFLVGGLLCVIAQLFIDWIKWTPAKILVSFVVSGVFLTAIKVYEPLVKFAGAGATIPLSGFGYTMANGVVEAIRDKGFLGIFTGGLTAGAAGIASAVLLGYIAALVSKSKDKS